MDNHTEKEGEAMTDTPPVQELVEQIARALHEARSTIPWEVTANQDIAYRDARALLPLIAAREEAARTAALEEAAKVAEVRHEQWRMPHPDDAMPEEVCCDVSACRDIAAAIRALSSEKEGE